MLSPFLTLPLRLGLPSTTTTTESSSSRRPTPQQQQQQQEQQRLDREPLLPLPLAAAPPPTGSVSVPVMMTRASRAPPASDAAAPAISSSSSSVSSAASWPLSFYTVAGLHAVVLITAVSLVSVLFAQADVSQRALLTTQSYALTPADAGCAAWLEGECVSAKTGSSLRMDWRALQGVMALHEHRTFGLFSDMNPAVVCLTVQAIALAFALTMGLEEEQEAAAEEEAVSARRERWLFKRVAFGILLGGALLLLFMQPTWVVSFNHLLWLEILFACAFFAIGTATTTGASQHQQRWRRRHGGGEPSKGALEQVMPVTLGAALTVPALAVSTLALAGENDGSALLVVYFALMAAPFVWVVRSGTTDADGRGVLCLNAWLCLVPFVLRASLRFEAIGRLPVGAAPPPWIVAALALALVWLVVGAACLTGIEAAELRSAWGWVYLADQVTQATLVLLILGGLMAN
jgi:hypothetical protein